MQRLEAVQAAIAASEKNTRAELVVVVAESAAPYREASLAVAWLTALAVLTFLHVAPWFELFPEEAALAILGATAVGYALGQFVPPLRRAFVSRTSRRREVDRAAKVAFLEEGVSATDERSGVLVYVSRFEPAVRILPDLGLQGKVADAEWGAIAEEIRRALGTEGLEKALAAGVARCGAVLAKHYPPRAENVNEIPDHVRFRVS